MFIFIIQILLILFTDVDDHIRLFQQSILCLTNNQSSFFCIFCCCLLERTNVEFTKSEKTYLFLKQFALDKEESRISVIRPHRISGIRLLEWPNRRLAGYLTKSVSLMIIRTKCTIFPRYVVHILGSQMDVLQYLPPCVMCLVIVWKLCLFEMLSPCYTVTYVNRQILTTHPEGTMQYSLAAGWQAHCTLSVGTASGSVQGWGVGGGFRPTNLVVLNKNTIFGFKIFFILLMTFFWRANSRIRIWQNNSNPTGSGSATPDKENLR